MPYFIEYATRETTSDDIEQAFQTLGKKVTRIEESITQDYKTSWNAFTIYVDEIYEPFILYTKMTHWNVLIA